MAKILLMSAYALMMHIRWTAGTKVIAREALPQHIESSATALRTPTFAPLVSDDDHNNASTAAYFWDYENCDEGQKTAIKDGLAEAHTVLDNSHIRALNIHWNDYATVEYLGSPYYLKHSKVDYQAMYDKAKDFKNTFWSFKKVQIICRLETERPCSGIDEPGYILVSNPTANDDSLKMYFCGRYFDLGMLKPILESGMANVFARDLANYENRARAWMTAIFRLSYVAGLDYQIVVYPKTGISRQADSPSECKYLAKNFGSPIAQKRASRSPSNWAWWAMAQLIMIRSGNYPHEPFTPRDLRSR